MNLNEYSESSAEYSEIFRIFGIIAKDFLKKNKNEFSESSAEYSEIFRIFGIIGISFEIKKNLSYLGKIRTFIMKILGKILEEQIAVYFMALFVNSTNRVSVVVRLVVRKRILKIIIFQTSDFSSIMSKMAQFIILNFILPRQCEQL